MSVTYSLPIYFKTDILYQLSRGDISTSGPLDADTENGRQYNATVVVSDGQVNPQLYI